MNKQEIEKAIEALQEMHFKTNETRFEMARVMAISALEKTSDKNCSMCIDKGKCAIHDNFNIDYCSDWRNEDE